MDDGSSVVAAGDAVDADDAGDAVDAGDAGDALDAGDDDDTGGWMWGLW